MTDVNSLRKGTYPAIKSFPSGIGKEAAGTIVGLPSDPEVLNHPSYKERGYKIGGKVALIALVRAYFPLYKLHKGCLLTSTL
jgi:hypothetical protein